MLETLVGGGPGSVSATANLIMIVAVILMPIGVISFLLRLRNEMKKDAGERFDTAAQLQNSINSMMTAFIVGLMRNNGNSNFNNGYNSHSTHKDPYVDWNLYEGDGRANQHDHKVVQLPGDQVPLLGNREAYPSYSQKKRRGGGFLIGLLSGVSIFLLLALITVLTVKI